ncbi:hypothetical protein HDK90DRAFT_297272 [Phyllosticta capitalensis]|uniref:Uncharacterized protein n=1 Tax=Phyllosticta capitalensis TaxID=121624 RepID=A0ABR1YJU9_9PEZI
MIVQRRRPSTGFSNAGLTRGTSAGVPGDGRPSALRSDGRVPSARRQRRPWLETVQVAVCYCDDTRAPDGNYRERRERWRAGRRDSKTHNTTEDRRVDSQERRREERNGRDASGKAVVFSAARLTGPASDKESTVVICLHAPHRSPTSSSPPHLPPSLHATNVIDEHVKTERQVGLCATRQIRPVSEVPCSRVRQTASEATRPQHHADDDRGGPGIQIEGLRGSL